MKKSHRLQAWAVKVLGVLGALCLTFSLGLTAAAATTGTVSSSSGANVRAEADTSSDLVASLEADAQVEVTDSTESGDYTWYYVTFTYEGSETSGWIRGDLLSVSEDEDSEEDTEDSEDADESSDEESSGGTTINGYTVTEPGEEYEDASSMDSSTVELDGVSYTAYMPTDGTEIYLVWATNSDGDSGWYWFEPDEETFQQDLGQFSSSGLISALQNELTSLKESSTAKLNTRLYMIIGLGVVAAVLLIVVTVLLIRNRGVEYIYEDEDDDATPENWYEDDDDDGYSSKSRREKKNRRDKKEKKKEKKRRADKYDDYDEDEDSYETGGLPDIDLSGVFADKGSSSGNAGTRKSASDFDDDDDFSDLEILDIDDFDD